MVRHSSTGVFQGVGALLGACGLLVCSALLGACDSGADGGTETVAAGGALVVERGAARPADRGGLHRNYEVRARPTLAPRPSARGAALGTPGPLDASELVNTACQAAAPLPDRGLVNVPAFDPPARGCEHAGYAQRYFELVVAPGEVVTVTSPGALGSSIGALWFSAGAQCPETSGACLAGWKWLTGGVALANPGAQPSRRLIAVTTTSATVEPSYALDVSRAALAPNAACAGAEPLSLGSSLHDFVGAGVDASDVGLQRALYYTIEVPPMTRAEVHVRGNPAAVAYVRWSCDDDLMTARAEIANTSEEPRTAFAVVGPLWTSDLSPFELALELPALAPESACERPRALSAGDVATFDIERGAAGPSTCWCFQPTRVVHVTVTVPAGQTAVVAGLSTPDSGAVLIELPSACAETCGDTIATGWGATAATLQLHNAGPSAQERHLIVTSNEVWDADFVSSSFPPVTLTVDLRE